MKRLVSKASTFSFGFCCNPTIGTAIEQDGATPEDLVAGNKEMQELFRKHHIHRMTQQRGGKMQLVYAL
jgi:hypothetical protein